MIPLYNFLFNNNVRNAAREALKPSLSADIGHVSKIELSETTFGAIVLMCASEATNFRVSSLSGVLVDCSLGIKPHVDKLDKSVYSNLTILIPIVHDCDSAIFAGPAKHRRFVKVEALKEEGQKVRGYMLDHTENHGLKVTRNSDEERVIYAMIGIKR